MLEIVHYLHIVSGVVYGGGTIIFLWVVAPASQKISGEARAAFSTASNKYAGPFMGGGGLLVFLTGILMAWMSGNIGSWADLWQGYGLMASLAVVVYVIWEALNGPLRAKMGRASQAGDDDEYMRLLGRSRLVSTVSLLVMLGLMVAMRFGAY